MEQNSALQMFYLSYHHDGVSTIKTGCGEVVVEVGCLEAWQAIEVVLGPLPHVAINVMESHACRGEHVHRLREGEVEKGKQGSRRGEKGKKEEEGRSGRVRGRKRREEGRVRERKRREEGRVRVTKEGEGEKKG